MSHDRSTCLFCKIADGEIPSTRVYEDDEFVAFRDIRPAAETHVLVIPRQHIATLADCAESDAPLLGRMLVLVGRIAKDLGVSYTGGDTGYRTVVNTGPGGGQEVYHLHAHLLAGPRPWQRMG
ncbi:histidine triad nucleotide-binding protein [Paraburkholderia caballeronis]|uniref:Histidine triad (HIT) family protein n=1 Tax=Paraburkholderia caballeronis TaxID=416943 RepID=A0A1H7V045_9BURK|nr:histidine triad nucleotide-binding protein [Paraburkholderia caballeronis]PXW17362.1 histidine triad (HIT) family protein [Paraburkholderia caballeronis]PXW94814.1 histidine triad (HIT) family protein [Paraburkholderia caballeronis]RAJ90712.1 histidine triad (HIT) family protein [Paraburkholderia caballeronis]TDV05672.1 histidine triad (HIT) family protein [Paraburkholderia caballeronis]TDV09413.1 histidine triad (HIT) family protein [Paraburkholderia caballeronis]